MNDAPLILALIGVTLGLPVSLGSLLPGRSAALLRHGALLVTTLMSLLWMASGLMVLLGHAPAEEFVLGSTIPWQFGLDPLAGFFLLVLGLVGTTASLHAIGYFRNLKRKELQRVLMPYPLFLSSMALVLLASGAYPFLVAWEFMALSSAFLVLAPSPGPAARRAATLYLVIAHLGALCLFAAFALLAHGDLLRGGSFALMAQQAHSPMACQIVFVLTLAGFGAKLGVIPLHAWLPEAHPAAPSPVSALMSASMLPIALYGLLRVDWQILPSESIRGGVIWLGLGLLSAAFAALFAVLQGDLKRLLAYSSIENMGLVLVAFGLARIFAGEGVPTLAVLALAAGLFQVLNHACFKSLLFLGSGSVLHSTRSVDMNRLGGLIRYMPQTSFLMLVGTLALAGLPPLNGFASEWMLLQAFLLAPQIPSGVFRTVLPLAAAGVVLIMALASAAIVKWFGLSFLGRPRSSYPKHEANSWERTAMGLLALACIGLGIVPGLAVNALTGIGSTLVHAGHLGFQRLWSLTPISPKRASYFPGVFLLGVVAAIGLIFLVVWWRFGRPLRHVPAWACGFAGHLKARMQDSPVGFSQPFLRVFQRVAHARITSDQNEGLEVHLSDPFWNGLYLPLERISLSLSRQALRLQHGRITSYLLYAFLTLVVLLVVIQ